MKRLFLLVLLSSSMAFGESNPSSITIGFLPGGDASDTKRGAVAIAQGLQDELNIPVNVYLSKNYSGLVDAMKNKKVDFAFFTALSYVVAENTAGAKVLLKSIWQEPFYYSTILVKANSKFKKIEDLKGQRFAFVDDKSTSGYLYPQVLLKKKHMTLKDFKEIKMTGSHSLSVEALDRGEVEGIAVFADSKEGLKNAYVKYSKLAHPEKQFRVLWTSEPIPNDPFCVRQDFYDQNPKLTHSLMFALIDVVEKQKDKKEVQKAVGAKGFSPATQKQYDPVREVVKELGLAVTL